MPNDSCQRIFLIRQDGTSLSACRLETVMTRAGDMLHYRQRACPADQQSDAAPHLRFIQAIKAVARGDTRLASGAGVEVDFEGVLLPGPGARQRDELSIWAVLMAQLAPLMTFRNRSNRREFALLPQEAVDQ